MLSDKQMYDRMKEGWRGGVKGGTPCGRGSLKANTVNARKAISRWCKEYDIRSVNDAGAGDLSWIKLVEWDVEYRPYDLIQWSPKVIQWDITRDALPPADAILCRTVLNHLDPPRVQMAVDLFRQSAKYLMATQIDEGTGRGSFSWLDLRPYLGEPIDRVQDGHETFIHLALWTL